MTKAYKVTLLVNVDEDLLRQYGEEPVAFTRTLMCKVMLDRQLNGPVIAFDKIVKVQPATLTDEE